MTDVISGLTDDDITTIRGRTGSPPRLSVDDRDTTDTSDADPTDGDTTDTSGTDGTDGADTDTVDEAGADADGVDAD